MEHDPITAADLAVFQPVFGALPPGTAMAPGPMPAVRRTLRSFEIVALARNYSLPLASAEDLCFELPLEPLDRDRVLAAMQTALPFPETRIEILETSRYPVPRGKIEFHPEDLSSPALPSSPAPVVWRGSVAFGANQRFAVWARVRVSARIPKWVATENIKPGVPISSSQVRVESITAFPELSAANPVDIMGRISLRSIPAGTQIRPGDIEWPPEVRRGDTVAVEVRSGAAHLALSGKSESDGRTGETISVRNLRSNKVFRARVDGKDRAVVDAGAPLGN
jgi:flagella basal body P-ring formation protein FlgA